MKKAIKKITALGLAAVTAAAVGVSVYADTYQTSHVWTATGRNSPGAPSYIQSEPDIFSIWHREQGARATQGTRTHEIHSSTGTTIITCRNFEMEAALIIEDNPDNTNDHNRIVDTHPNVGRPTVDIEVKYTITAVTDTVGDTFVSKGTIKKIS